MRVKRYVVDSMPDALQKIRTDLGKDAVILNTKEIRTGGFLGFFAKKKIEVIAATDTAASAPASLSAAKTSGHNSVKPVVPRTYNPYAAAMKKAKEQVAVLDAEQERPGPDESVVAEIPAAPNRDKQPAIAQTSPVAQNLSVTQTSLITQIPPVAPNPSVGREREDALMEELKQMKEMMFKLSQQYKETEKRSPALQTIEERLLRHEVDPLIVFRLMEHVEEEAAEQGVAEITESFAVESVRKQLAAMLTSGQNKHIAPDTKIAHFVGPTGVGKTTTIAKLAAEQVLKYQRKVGFITSDTYRIAAVEQLKTYATILNIPLEVVCSPQDLSKAFQQLEDRDIIFMDTAGRNYRNEMYVSELNALLQSRGKSETFLVLSLTTKYKDMKVITNNFTKFRLDKVLFTKMDETDSYGSILNLVNDFNLQLSYIANGQSVPDDIMEVNEQQIADLLVEEHNND